MRFFLQKHCFFGYQISIESVQKSLLNLARIYLAIFSLLFHLKIRKLTIKLIGWKAVSFLNIQNAIIWIAYYSTYIFSSIKQREKKAQTAYYWNISVLCNHFTYLCNNVGWLVEWSQRNINTVDENPSIFLAMHCSKLRTL